MDIINGPSAPQRIGGMIYQVTLMSGMIATNPLDFGPVEKDAIAQETVVTEDGRVLIYPAKL
jgi:hypothetical protein